MIMHPVLLAILTTANLNLMSPLDIMLIKARGYEDVVLFSDLEAFEKIFGGWSVDKELFDVITKILPEGKTLLELGSGWATGEFSKLYTVYSIEHNKEWVGKYASNYIYAPIKNGWYDTAVLAKELPKNYDLILVDGPPGAIGRGKFYDNLDLFNTNVPMIFDDVNRGAEYNLMVKVAKKLNRKFEIFDTSSNKQFGVIMPD